MVHLLLSVHAHTRTHARTHTVFTVNCSPVGITQVQQTRGMGAQGIMGGSGVTPPTPLQPMSSGCASSLDGPWV